MNGLSSGTKSHFSCSVVTALNIFDLLLPLILLTSWSSRLALLAEPTQVTVHRQLLEYSPAAAGRKGTLNEPGMHVTEM